jgi:hypothetical protein
MRLRPLSLFLILAWSAAAACGGKVVLDTPSSSSTSSGTGGLGTSTAVTATSGDGPSGTSVVTSSSSLSSSSSSGVPCTNPITDCKPSETVCVEIGCSNGVCVASDAPPGTACVDSGGRVCNGGGQCVQCNGVPDCPAQPTACVAPLCLGNVCSLKNAPAGAACADSGGDVCDGAGHCVACAPGTPACCITMCETDNVVAYETFVGYELKDCGCAAGTPCAGLCTAECADPSTLTATSPCGMCLESQTLKAMSSPCTVNAGTTCIGDPKCASFVSCGLACP